MLSAFATSSVLPLIAGYVAPVISATAHGRRSPRPARRAAPGSDRPTSRAGRSSDSSAASGSARPTTRRCPPPRAPRRRRRRRRRSPSKSSATGEAAPMSGIFFALSTAARSWRPSRGRRARRPLGGCATAYCCRRSGASSIGASPPPSSSASAALAAAAAVVLPHLEQRIDQFSATFTRPLKSSRASSLSPSPNWTRRSRADR